MIHESPVRHTRLSRCKSRAAAPIVLIALVIFGLAMTPVGIVTATSLNPAPAARSGLSTGTTLAVAHATGASLYDDAGKLLVDLPGGTAVKISGRTADNRWFYGATRDGTTGWVSADGVVIFGVNNVPERAGFTEPAPAPAASATLAAATAAATREAAAPAGVRLPAVVASSAQRLNVRSGPGTTYAVIGTVGAGAALSAGGRNAASDWIQVEGAAIPGGSGWVSASFLELDGKVTDLQVADLLIAAAPAAAGAANARGEASSAPAQPAGLAGKLVFQESSGGNINVYDLAHGSLRTLTTGADPDLSPDGKTVVFWRGDGAENGLYLIDVDCGDERRILTRTEKLRAPSWSPDGSRIVFSHVQGENRCRDVGYGICLPDRYPYNRMFPLITNPAWALASIDRDGGSYADLPVEKDALSPDWSEHGILYGGTGIHVTQDAADDSQNRVVLDEYRYRNPAGQPGGDRIVFESLEKDHWEIFSAGVDGSGVTALTRPATTLVDELPHNVAPAWSPDGQHIVFLSNRTGKWQFWVMNADGSDPRALPLNAPITYGYQAEQVVSWGK